VSPHSGARSRRRARASEESSTTLSKHRMGLRANPKEKQDSYHVIEGSTGGKGRAPAGWSQKEWDEANPEPGNTPSGGSGFPDSSTGPYDGPVYADAFPHGRGESKVPYRRPAAWQEHQGPQSVGGGSSSTGRQQVLRLLKDLCC